MKDGIFLCIAAVTVFGALVTAFSRSIINAALGLLLALVAIAGLYIFLSADFVAVSQILIYVGGVMVLLLFGIMLTSGGDNIFSNNPIMGAVPATLITTIFGLLGIYVVNTSGLTFYQGAYRATTRDIGHFLLREYILPFELVSVLIVVLIVGAGVMLRKELVIVRQAPQKKEGKK
ncbi:MAG: NADH-quinone oxidoreductase subunit J [Spirochaetia bacterium]|nr:NADH-quinone oxidoreductase subunit J [Spirochaetia bacterium]